MFFTFLLKRSFNISREQYLILAEVSNTAHISCAVTARHLLAEFIDEMKMLKKPEGVHTY
jgi:hypothetical protein